MASGAYDEAGGASAMRCANGLDSKYVASRSSQFSSQSQESTAVGHAVRLGGPQTISQVLDDKRNTVILEFWGPPHGSLEKTGLASLIQQDVFPLFNTVI